MVMRKKNPKHMKMLKFLLRSPAESHIHDGGQIINLLGVIYTSLTQSEGRDGIRGKRRDGVESPRWSDGEDGIDPAPSHRFPPQIRPYSARWPLALAQHQGFAGGEDAG